MHSTSTPTSVRISRNSSPVWAEAPVFGAAALFLGPQAILNLGISAEIDLPVRSVETGESGALVSPFRGGVVNESRGARGGHRGNGKDAWSRILRVTHGCKVKRRCFLPVLSRCYVIVIVAWGGRYRWWTDCFSYEGTAPVSRAWHSFRALFRFRMYLKLHTDKDRFRQLASSSTTTALEHLHAQPASTLVLIILHNKTSHQIVAHSRLFDRLQSVTQLLKAGLVRHAWLRLLKLQSQCCSACKRGTLTESYEYRNHDCGMHIR